MDNLGRLLLRTMAVQGDKPALFDADVVLTYRELHEAAIALEASLRAVGVRPHEPVIVPVANQARDLAAFVGAWLAGAVAVPVARSAPPAAIEGVYAATMARFSLTNDAHERVSQVASNPPPDRTLLEGAAVVIFTSGSTGRPKGVVLSHRAFVGKLATIDSQLNFGPRTQTSLVLQISFIFGLWLALLTLWKGGTLRMQARFDPAEVVAALRSDGISDVALVPTMLRKILSLDEAVSRPLATDVDCRILTGGEPFGGDLSRKLQTLLPNAPVVDIYGSTETCSSDFFLRADERARFAGTIGRPGPKIQFRIADNEGGILPVDAIGELQIRTPFIMNGYLDEPELTRSAFAGGFFRTGDLARMRGDGRVELVGRAKDVINRAGAKVSPLELDWVLVRHPAVAAALTVGVPDPIVGESIHALVVPRDDMTVDEKGLRAWIAEQVERFKRPDVYHFGSELPTGRTGKVDRNALRQQILETRVKAGEGS
jgi:long-chain acyl-CoA synthetase